jgi:hypothetical protein
MAMASILDMIAPTLLNDNTVSMISQQLGIDEATARKGIEMGAPLLLSALANNTRSPEGAEALSNAVAQDHSARTLEDPTAALEKYQSGEGGAILNHVLGGQKAQVEQQLSQNTGIDAGKLLEILAPMIMGGLAAQQGGSVNPGGLAGELQQTQTQMQQSDNPIIAMATQMLDANRDGSMIDDILGMVARYFMGGGDTGGTTSHRR